MTTGYRYELKHLDSGARAITFPGFPEFLSIIEPADDPDVEARAALLLAIENRLDYGGSIPEAVDEVGEGRAVASASPVRVLHPEGRMIFSYEGKISQEIVGFFESAIIPNLALSIPELIVNRLKITVIELCQDFLEAAAPGDSGVLEATVRLEIAHADRRLMVRVVNLKVSPAVCEIIARKSEVSLERNLKNEKGVVYRLLPPQPTLPLQPMGDEPGCAIGVEFSIDTPSLDLVA